MEPTEITAGRLHLRPWHASDEDVVFAICQDPEIQRWTTVPVPYTREEARAFVSSYCPERWTAGTAASFAVLDATTSAVLASVSLHAIENGTAEVGYWCASEARGRGVMSEALGAVCRWGFAQLNLERIGWAAATGNWASRAVAQKQGFTIEGTARGWLMQRGQRLDAWRGALLRSDEVVDRRPLPVLPVLADGVVTLRAWSLDDVPASVKACNDADMTRFRAAPQPYTDAHAQHWITTVAHQGWADGQAAEFAVTDLNGDLLGGVGLKLRMPTHGVVEVSYWTAPRARGRGVAGRAATLCAAWAFDVLDAVRVELWADVENLPSLKVAERAGFVREGVARASRRDGNGTPRDMVVFSRVKERC